MYKVFIKNKVILFTNNQTNLDAKFNSLLWLNFFEEDTTNIIIKLLLKSDKIQGIVVCVNDVDIAFNQFKSSLKLIKAAGGWVKNKNNETLFIYRLGKWDLPKGKVEKKEEITEAAIREVEEECAVSALKIIAPLKDTFHIYTINDKPVLKQTYWFEMETTFEGELKPQVEEGIEEVRWMSNDEMKNVALSNTYASIADFIAFNVCF